MQCSDIGSQLKTILFIEIMMKIIISLRIIIFRTGLKVMNKRLLTRKEGMQR